MAARVCRSPSRSPYLPWKEISARTPWASLLLSMENTSTMPRTELRGIVEVFSIERSNDAHGVRALISFQGRYGLRLGDLHTRAAIYVVHPDFAGPDSELGFGNEEVFAVGRPAWRGEVV